MFVLNRAICRQYDFKWAIVTIYSRTTQITKRTVTPLVDYSDDESYDDNDDENKTTSMENDGRKPDYEPRGGDEPELVPTAPGLAILARSFIECGTTGPYVHSFVCMRHSCSSSLSIVMKLAVCFEPFCFEKSPYPNIKRTKVELS